MSIRLRFPNGKAKAVTLSYDDGVYQDIRLIEIMNKYGVKGTFNINTGRLSKNDAKNGGTLSEKQAKELYKKSGQEVAVHTYTHAMLETIQKPEITSEVIKDKMKLEEMFGGIVRGMAYPYGTYNDDVIDCLKACGIAYSRTVNSTRTFNLPDNWLILNPTCHHNDPNLENLTQAFLDLKVPGMHQSKMFYLWGHSYEFDTNNNWEIIESFCKKISGKNDIWYASNIEICEYVEAYNRLRYNVNRDYIENPTNKDIWLMHNDELVVIKAGESIHF